jgi:20S proteasome subunit alpha 7
MSSIGTGYDLSVSTYSPDGRLFQVRLCHHQHGWDICAAADLNRWNTPTRLSKLQGTSLLPACILLRLTLRSVAIGLRCKDGVILAVERMVHSKLLVPGSNKRILGIDRHIGLVSRETPPSHRLIV